MTKSTAKSPAAGRSRARNKPAQAASAYAAVQRSSGRGGKTPPANARLSNSAQARAIKDEICAVGRKLWLRQLVDGNGGNISYRIGPNEVICTPTLVSKYDLTPADLCLVDLNGKQIAGKRQATSEILLHLEIYKNVPEARAVVHCHPPHAAAYAITGQAPASRLMPEYEVFIGKVGIAPYETPGTAEFARTVLPQVCRHNAMLLSNHGAVCWAESVTMAEWNCEVLETYCTVLMLAGHLGVPLAPIPDSKASDLEAIRRRLGYPPVNGEDDAPRADAAADAAAAQETGLEELVQRVTREVLRQLRFPTR